MVERSRSQLTWTAENDSGSQSHLAVGKVEMKVASPSGSLVMINHDNIRLFLVIIYHKLMARSYPIVCPCPL